MKKKFLSFILAICLLIPSGMILTACDGHICEYETIWSTSSTEHWHKCSSGDCLKTKDKATHNLEDGVCLVCGYDTNHSHEYGSSYLNDGEHHWQKCQYCDNTTTKADHTYSGNSCSVCGYENSASDLPVVSSVRDLEIRTLSTNSSGFVTLVSLPDGKYMLIDSGCDDLSDEIEVDDLLLGLDITTIDYFVSSNVSAFRNGAADLVFQSYDVKNFYKPIIGTGITPSDEYNTAVECAENEANCNVATIDESSCDIEYIFKDSQNNTHSYKIDFMLPLAAENAIVYYDCSVVIAIEYQGRVVLITSDASELNIDAYCSKYGTKYDVDILVTSYNYSDRFAIASSASRGSDFLSKISFEESDYVIIMPKGHYTGIENLEGILTQALGGTQRNFHSLTQARSLSIAQISITTAGVIIVISK